VKIGELKAMLAEFPDDTPIAVIDGFGDLMPLWIGVLPADRWVDADAGSHPRPLIVVMTDDHDKEFGEASPEVRSHVTLLQRR
jgi:hypothetical protein